MYKKYRGDIIRATIDQYEKAVHEFHRTHFVPSHTQINARIVQHDSTPPKPLCINVRKEPTCKYDNAYINLIAKAQLVKTFKNVEPVTYGAGYNFLCDKHKRIQVASSIKRPDKGWLFRLRRSNKIDYYMLIAYNANRIDPKPVHTWLIPANVLARRQNLFISTLSNRNWKEYEQAVEVE